jgi:hypothetical protein
VVRAARRPQCCCAVSIGGGARVTSLGCWSTTALDINVSPALRRIFLVVTGDHHIILHRAARASGATSLFREMVGLSRIVILA